MYITQNANIVYDDINGHEFSMAIDEILVEYTETETPFTYVNSDILFNMDDPLEITFSHKDTST